MRVQRRLGSLVLALVALGGCTNKEPPPPDADEAVEATEPAPVELDLWAGVPALEPELVDTVGVLEPRPGPLSPPTVRETIELPLAPLTEEPVVPPPIDPAPLTVERHGPTGPQGLVDAIRLTFDQPMVPLADVAALRAKPIPLILEPAVAGEVKWLGTRTLAFMPEAGRMPFSTETTITVPAGVTSTWGTSLAEELSWTITTPTLALESSVPWDRDSQVELSPTITLEFNPAIETTALVAAMTLAGGRDRLGLKLAPLPKDPPPVSEPEWKAARRVQVVPERALRPDTRYTLKVPGGVFGEGPLASKPITLSFSTYQPLSLSKRGCPDTCWANEGITLIASNQLSDPDVAGKVHVEPEPPGLSVTSGWSGIQLTGDFEGRTRYRVTVDAGLQDVFGQTLARKFSTVVTLGPPYPQVSPMRPIDGPAVIEKAAPTKDLELLVAGVGELQLQARSMPVDELPTFLNAWAWGDERTWPTGLPAATYTERITTAEAMRHGTRMKLDLGPALSGGEHLWINVRSNPVKLYGWTQRYGTHMMVEVTDLGVATAIDRDSGLVMVSRLSTGEPVVGATVRLLEAGDADAKWKGSTDAQGLAHIDEGARDANLLVVEHEGDSALLRIDRSDLRGRWRSYRSSPAKDTPRAFFYSDRTPYKPGDTAHVSGILRLETRGPKGGVEPWRSDFTAEYVVTNPRGVEVAKGTTKVGALGTFSIDVPTKEEHGTGDFQLVLTVGSLLGSEQRFFHSFPVETYRAPELTVAVERTDSEPLVFGDELVAEIRGEYLYGAPLVGGEVSWVLRRAG
ncbi:MAG: Ig-like domain-containing protein, partial [Nannocystaceae bacterium]